MDITAYRAEFPITGTYAYVNHAAISPLNRRVRQAVDEHFQIIETTPFDRLRDEIFGMVGRMRERAARLINAADVDEIVEMPNTAAGINTAANSLPLRAGDNVLVVEGDYPSNVYPWLNLAPKGVLVKVVPQHNGGVDLDRLAARIDVHTKAVAVSTAMFATGYRNEVEAIGALCRERDIFFVVDAIQTLGAFPIDVQAAKIDFLAVGSQKWMLSIPGAGFLYCRGGIVDRLQLGAYVGAVSTVDAFNFLDYNFTLQPSAQRFSLGAPNLAGLAALDAALGLILEVGAEPIGRRILELTDVLIGDLQERGYTIVSNLDSLHRSGIVIVELPDAPAAYERLLEAGIVTSPRGAGLRVSPHFYNSEADVLRVGEALGRHL